MTSLTPNKKSLIILWAFAESGIGGILHALKLPFTGIFVGGIAIICITLLGSIKSDRKHLITEALAIVLMVKLAVSPHSPWQAYVAVIFQGLLGYLLFRFNGFYKTKVFIFSIICMLESAIQKILITILIYGTAFLNAFDAAAISVMKAIGITADTSVVHLLFITYILLHLLVGIILGVWIPNIPRQMKDVSGKIPDIYLSSSPLKKHSNPVFKKIMFGFTGLACILLCIKLLVPQEEISALFFILIRSLLISVALIMILSPLITGFIRRYLKRQTMDRIMIQEVLDVMPNYTQRAFHLLSWVNEHQSGWRKIKFMVLGLLILSMESDEKEV